MDHSLGAVKVAPPAVVDGVSFASVREAGFAAAAGCDAGEGAGCAAAWPPGTADSRATESSRCFICVFLSQVRALAGQQASRASPDAG
jgi:hypothetical protein